MSLSWRTHGLTSHVSCALRRFICSTSTLCASHARVPSPRSFCVSFSSFPLFKQPCGLRVRPPCLCDFVSMTRSSPFLSRTPSKHAASSSHYITVRVTQWISPASSLQATSPCRSCSGLAAARPHSPQRLLPRLFVSCVSLPACSPAGHSTGLFAREGTRYNTTHQLCLPQDFEGVICGQEQ